MSGNGPDNTDASSIKPVSSLLSHFEQLTTPIGNSIRSRSQSPNPIAHQTFRSSPASPTGLHTQEAAPNNWQNGSGWLQPTAAEVGRQRPVSTGPKFASQYSPAVTIEPPKSPPKPSNLSLTISGSRGSLAPETPIAASAPGIASPRHFRIPSRPQTPLVESRKPPLLSPSPASQPPEPPPPRRSGELRREAPAKPLPRAAPIPNRLEKPKIPAKRNSVYGQTTDREAMIPVNTQSTAYRELPASMPTSRGVSPNRPFMVASAAPSRLLVHDTAPRVNLDTEPYSPAPISLAAAKRREFEPISRSIAVESSDEQKPSLPARPRPPPSKPFINRSMSNAMPDTRANNQQDLQPYARNPQVVDRSVSLSRTPERNISASRSHPPTPPRSYPRSMSVDQTAMRKSTDSQHASRTTYEAPESSIPRSSQAQPPTAETPPSSVEYPDPSRSNRRPPIIGQSVREIPVKFDARIFDVIGEYACSSGTFTRAWNLVTGDKLLNLNHGETVKIMSISFKAFSTPEEEGQRLWLGNNVGDLVEVDIASQSVVATKSAAHSRHEVIKIYRHKDEMWTLDDVGTLHIWVPNKATTQSFDALAQTFRVPKGHTFSLVVCNELWYATGKDLRVFDPTASEGAPFQLLQRPLCQSSAGEVVSGATINSQPDRVYFGHTDGKVTIYSRDRFTCLDIINVSLYKINSLVGVGQHLWAGFNTGLICVYDTTQTPWVMKKDWRAHENPVIGIIADRNSSRKLDRLQVISLGADNLLKQWDGLLREDWLENEMRARDAEFCTFQNIRTLVMTWNAGASTPSSLRNSDQDSSFVRNLLNSSGSPDILIFGFQELVDLEDKKATAMSFFKSKKKDAHSDQERMSHQYRDWRDYLVRCLDDFMPKNELYHLLQSSTLVGLFTCIFVKSHLRDRIKNLGATEVKRGMGGLHGNKGALIIRFVVDDTSMCFVNCHLAAGQAHTKLRNHDISAILESTVLPVERDSSARLDSYIGGGDGSMILDHEVCIINGDLNYRIDTMGRDAVVNAVKAGNLAKLLERDQLLVSKRKNPGFRLRAFQEMPIAFNPTYKYDVGTDTYDTSEKKRSPAWCDRILYRDGHVVNRIKQFDYRRHEVRVSDHRPVSALFEMTIKSVLPRERASTWDKTVQGFEKVKKRLLTN
ncbi:hypothetical protein VC83_01769 [Pseudogymnoascus destructans]|uniref:Inositol polyphosphate-related phosphatase domain-containing protein n=2 Tax=Pseudogymnoascus destructans TaxID=655981 RepID=L8GA07_PSED2|nr:uncharacterized protein VC83_01769 [Pseudogymnoascus destructans]ELR08876.1 hypothetical protein GMDG_03546 [Pseudogymnoascus destructans 20631-21]OAF61929.1 hypothetical protein VC83_01769 [Pseudogymnoascus destructans]